MLTKRNVSSAAEATGRSLSYQGQQSMRQMCLPLSASEDGRKIRQITKQNSFHEEQSNSYNRPQLTVDRRFRNAPPAFNSDNHNRIKMATPSRLPGGGGVGGPPPMSTSWTSGGDGSSDDVPGAWRQFRNSDRALRGFPGQRLSSAKFASSIDISLDNDSATKGSEPHASTMFASPSAIGGTGRGGGGGVGSGGVEGGSMGTETGRYFYQSPSPGTQTELARIFEGPIHTPPYHVRSSEGVQNGTQRTMVLNVLPPGSLETSTAGSYPELHNIALHESRRGSLPAPRKLDETSSTAIVRVRRKENPYENSSLSSNRPRNESNLYRSNGDSNHQNGNGKTSTTFHDGNSFMSSSDGNSFLNACDGKRFWSGAHNGTTVSRQDRYVDGTARENIYEEIDSSSLRSSSTSGNSAKVFNLKYHFISNLNSIKNSSQFKHSIPF